MLDLNVHLGCTWFTMHRLRKCYRIARVRVRKLRKCKVPWTELNQQKRLENTQKYTHELTQRE